ncbi:MAG: lysophospholipid acyltransferase family protein, partial [Desulfobulbaceae bacterium]
KTKALFHEDWLDSGDLAYMADGEVYVTGRIKDIIIRGGRNVYPHELEEAIGNLEGIRKGCVAVFGSRDMSSGTERLVILAESRKKDPEAIDRLRREVSNAAVDLLDMPPDEIVIAPPGTVLKTSSGKIRRAASREIYEQGRIGRPGRAVWLQFSRLALAGLLPQARRLLHRVADNLYAGYAWTVYGLLCIPIWPLVVLLPGQKARWRVTRFGARLLALLTATRLEVKGAKHIPRDRPLVIAANHMSYLDAYVVQAVLPVPCGFIAKAELAKKPLVRIPLARLGAIMVERFDRERISADAERIAGLAGLGRNLFFFPEGTFQRMPGLLPFRMGAFLTAAQGNIPVVPVTIRGTRNKLRSGSWFPRRGPISVVIGRPVFPDGNDWAAAIRLREAVRREILRHLGEPDLAASFTPFADLDRPEAEAR